jgi:hypothetical protein
MRDVSREIERKRDDRAPANGAGAVMFRTSQTGILIRWKHFLSQAL